MTIEELDKYRGVCANIEAIKMQIKSLYVPISSPNGKENIGSFGNTPGNPTERAVNEIIRLQDDLSEQLKVQVDMLKEINEWMRDVSRSDPEIAALVRFHYIAGLSWKETARKMYGHCDDHVRLRKKVSRFLYRNQQSDTHVTNV